MQFSGVLVLPLSAMYEVDMKKCYYSSHCKLYIRTLQQTINLIEREIKKVFETLHGVLHSLQVDSTGGVFS